MNDNIGLIEVLYEDDYNLDNVNSITVDRRGSIYWSADKYGEEVGTIHRASADDPSIDSVEKECKLFEEASGLFYRKEFLFFIAPGNKTDEKAIYYKSVPRTGEITPVVNKVVDGFKALVSVSTLDEFIYFADSEVGIVAVESYHDGTFSEGRVISLNTGDVTDPVAPMPQTMVIFAMGAIHNIVFGFSILAGLLAINLF